MRTLTVALAILATYRVTLLITADTITAPLRERLFRWRHDRLHRVTIQTNERPVPDHPEKRLEATCSCGWSASARPSHDDRYFMIVTQDDADALPPEAPTRGQAIRIITGLADRHAHRRDIGTPLEVFLTCPWCVSVWLGAGAAVLVGVWPTGWWRWIALGLAASAVTGLLATLASPDGDQ